MSKSDRPDGLLLNEYYHIPMFLLYRELAAEVREAAIGRPKQFERRLLASYATSANGSPLSWEDLLAMAEVLEDEIARVLSQRHVFFWQHLYRRTFPIVRDEAGEEVDQVTARLVRSICEAAVVKHGKLSGRSGLEDIATADAEKVFGGWLAKGVRKMARTNEEADRYLRHLQTGHQWVIVEFDGQDLVSLHYAEGLCYQYWKLTARLRSVGKGAMLLVYEDGSTAYVPNDELRRLFARYDARAASFSHAEASALGVWYEREAEGEKNILCLMPNAGKLDIGPIFAARGLNMQSPDGTQFVSNCVPYFMGGDAFKASHEYIADAFMDAKGFTLTAVVELLHVVSVLALAHYSTEHADKFGEEMARTYYFYTLCKRGYMLMSASEAVEFLRLIRTHLGSRGLGEAEIEALYDAFTLTDTTRCRVSLWSRGPQFVFHPYEEVMMVDFCGMVELLHNLFYRVKDDAHARGMIFERNVRDAIQANGICLEQRNFKFADGTKAEADAVFYRGDSLIVVDCFSMWRPLDFEISRPKTMDRRRGELEDKIRYAIERTRKLARERVGRNFDFSKARNFVTMVVTPQVEWLWDESDLLWVEPGLPRVMQANEFVAWASNER